MEPTDEAGRRLRLRRQLGAGVAHRRLAKEWSQARLAREVGVDVGTVSRIERGARGTSDLTLVALATALEVEVGQLFLPVPTSSEVAS